MSGPGYFIHVRRVAGAPESVAVSCAKTWWSKQQRATQRREVIDFTFEWDGTGDRPAVIVAMDELVRRLLDEDLRD